MADTIRLRRAGARLLGSISVLLALYALTIAAGPGAASAAQRRLAAQSGQLPIPGAFRLQASNGYTLDVTALPPHAGRPGALLIYASARGRFVRYFAPATVTETSMQADLGELGEISLNFQRTNQAASAPCGHEEVYFDSGHWEGRLDFHGEEGYTSVEATTIPGEIGFLISELCGEGFLEGGLSRRPRGAALDVRNPGLGPELSVTERRPGAAARIAAWTSEFDNGISIVRSAVLRVPSDAFKFGRDLRTATVRPPAPFAGSAHFDLREKAGKRWSGNLTVDLPGRSGVPLTGPMLRATLKPSG